MLDLLRKNIRRNIDVSDTQLEEICSFFNPQKISKGEYVLRQGNVFKFEGFVTTGCFRIFTIDTKGNENILYFATTDWWLIDADSFMNQSPSELNIQALEDSEVLLINRTDKAHLYDQMPLVERLFRVMFQKALIAWQRRVVQNHCLTGKERYLHFLDTYPEIASRLTDKQIARYLGITHEFLSKIKSKL